MSFANTPEGKAQPKRLTECRLALGCKSAKDFFNRYSNGLFSYPQYQKYESGERLLARGAAILYAKIFNVDYEWLQNGSQSEPKEEIILNEEEKEYIRNLRKSQKVDTNEKEEQAG